MSRGVNHGPVISEARMRVRYAETDQMGVVYHANYFVWFEVGRVELLRQLGFSYRDMEQNDGCGIAVIEPQDPRDEPDFEKYQSYRVASRHPLAVLLDFAV